MTLLRATVGRGGQPRLRAVRNLVAKAARPVPIHVAIFGSTVTTGRLVGDLDLWIEGGDQQWLDEGEQHLRDLEERLGRHVDVFRPDKLRTPLLEAAVRLRVREHGSVIQGYEPAAPTVSIVDVDQPFRDQALLDAREAFAEATAHANIDEKLSAELLQLSLQRWLLSRTRSIKEWRFVKRLDYIELIRAVETLDRRLSASLVRDSWSSADALARLDSHLR